METAKLSCCWRHERHARPRSSSRQLPHCGHARPRRDGLRLRGRARGPRPQGCAEDAPARPHRATATSASASSRSRRWSRRSTTRASSPSTTRARPTGSSTSPCATSAAATSTSCSQTGPLEPDRAVAILEQVAGALDAAHAHDLVHRDVKPANVLLETRRPRLPDRLRDREASAEPGPDPGRASSSARSTTPPPSRSAASPVGPPADIYAFGCLLFECLTGRKPFDRETDVAVMHAHLLDPPPSALASCGPTSRRRSTRSFAQGARQGGGRALRHLSRADRGGARLPRRRSLLVPPPACARPRAPTPAIIDEPADDAHAADRPRRGAGRARRARRADRTCGSSR